jgi:hypothetical protein
MPQLPRIYIGRHAFPFMFRTMRLNQRAKLSPQFRKEDAMLQSYLVQSLNNEMLITIQGLQPRTFREHVHSRGILTFPSDTKAVTCTRVTFQTAAVNIYNMF